MRASIDGQGKARQWDKGAYSELHPVKGSRTKWTSGPSTGLMLISNARLHPLEIIVSPYLQIVSGRNFNALYAVFTARNVVLEG